MIYFEKMEHEKARIALESGLAVAPTDTRLRSAIDQLEIKIVKQRVGARLLATLTFLG